MQSTCEVCGVEYETTPSDKGRYCSKACWSVRKPPKERECNYCHEIYLTRDIKSSYCSRQCVIKDKKEKKRPRIIGDESTTKLRHILGVDLVEWRMSVYKRDNYTCQKCGKKGNIQAHHIIPLVVDKSLALDINNGITLCIPCHQKEHNHVIRVKTKFHKICLDCGKPTSGRGERCGSCGVKHHHLSHAADKIKTCLYCHKEFTPSRADKKYCSAECGKLSTLSHSIVKCSSCGKEIKRSNAFVLMNKTGNWHCSNQCRTNTRTRIKVTCPVCSIEFEIKPYRLKSEITPTCSLSCARKLPHIRKLAAESTLNSPSSVI